MNFYSQPLYSQPLTIGGNKTGIRTGIDYDINEIIANELAARQPSAGAAITERWKGLSASPTSSAASIPTHEAAKKEQSKWEKVGMGLGDAIDSWNKGNWAMEEENNRRAGEGADRTMNLLRMIPSMYEARNSARKANFGLAGMAGQ